MSSATCRLPDYAEHPCENPRRYHCLNERFAKVVQVEQQCKLACKLAPVCRGRCRLGGGETGSVAAGFVI